MKQKIILFFTATMFGALLYGQKSQNSLKPKPEIPAVVKESFSIEFPGAIARWDKEGDQYEANFRYKGKVMSALFEADGNMTESEVSIKISELPSPVLLYVKEHYKGAKIKEAAKITKSNGEINYEAEVRGLDVLFDEQRKFIREAKD